MIGPVMIEVVRSCQFVAKPCGICGKQRANAIHRKKNVKEGKEFCPFRRQNGCATCGGPKGGENHYGEPPSLNAFATGYGTGEAMGRAKAAWQAILLRKLQATDLPADLGRVYVSGEIVFPADSRRRDGEYNRDQGNYRFTIEKALGDALEEGGYLKSDGWHRYEFGDLSQRVEPGVSATRLTIFPLGNDNEMEKT